MGYFTEVFLVPALLTLGYFYGPYLINGPAPAAQHLTAPQTQLTTEGPLLTENGTLSEAGYSTSPLKYLDRNNMSTFQTMRLKKWDYYDVITDEMAVSFAVADLYFVGEIRVNYFNFNTREAKGYRKIIYHSVTPTLSNTSYLFTDESAENNIQYKDDDFKLKVTNLGSKHLEKHNTKEISVSCAPIGLKLKFTMSLPIDQDIMAAVVPLDKDSQYFIYTLKIANGVTEGSLKVGDQEHQITKRNSGGFIDWTRAVWTYNSYWVFARAQGFVDGKRFSLNLGSGYGDKETITATEDGFFIDTKLYKLNTVEPKFDDNNLMNPFEFKTADTEKGGMACEIIFAPNYIDKVSANYLVIKSDMRVVYGQFSGWVSDDKGKKHKFENINGYAEVFKTKW